MKPLRTDITSSPQENVIQIGKLVLLCEQPFPQWSHSLLKQIGELSDLEEDWDSYGAQPIDPRCVLTAVEIILNLMDHRTPPPSIVPTSGGGIQLEWHRAGADLEIEIQSPTKTDVFFEDGRTSDEREFSISGSFEALQPLLHRISQDH